MGKTGLYNPQSLLKEVVRSIGSLLIPPVCCHCGEGVGSPDQLFCEICLAHLVPLDKDERCPRCFFPLEKQCRCKRIIGLNARGAVFSAAGPASSLLRSFIQDKQLHLSKGIAAYLVYQLITINWPIPDLILPVEISALDKYRLGFQPNQIISCEMVRFFSKEWTVFDEGDLRGKKVLLLNLTADFAPMKAKSQQLLRALPEKIYALNFLNPNF